MKFLAILFLTLSLQAAGFWTLTGLQKANIYIKNELTTLKPTTLSSIRIKMESMLKKNDIKTAQQDSATIMISLEEIVDDESHYIYIKLALGEEVKTFRDDGSATFALTYNSTDFIELEDEDLDSGVLESVDFLLEQFEEQFEDDKE